MASIKIKGRDDPVFLPNEKAFKIKQRWTGDPERGVPKAARNDIVDLGDWSGEYGSIRTIELDKFTFGKPDALDEDQLKKIAGELLKFKQERRGTPGRLIPASDLYCASIGLIRIDEYGSVVVHDAGGYRTVGRYIEEIQNRAGKKAYAKKKELEELSRNAAAQMSVD